MVSFLCEFCGKPYLKRYALENHLEQHRRDKIFPSVKCKECEKIFEKSDTLRKHINSVHRVKKVRPPRMCQFCMKSFVNLPVHLRRHPESVTCKHRCEQCTKVYPRRGALLDHIRRDHTGERPFVCKHCSKPFSSSIGLKAHLAVESPRLCKSPTPRFRADQKCPLCPKTYTRRRYLRIHLFTHTGTHPFRCSGCWKAFQSPFLRSQHQKECRHSNFHILFFFKETIFS